MKIERRRLTSGWVGVVLALLLLPADIVRAASTPLTLTFKYTVTKGTCDVSVGGDAAGTDGVLPFGDVTFPAIVPGPWKVIGTEKNVYVKLSNCIGAGAAGETPVVTIVGETTNYSGVHPDDTAHLFVNNTASTAKGFGFVILNGNKAPIPTFTAATDSNKYVNAGTINIPAADQIITLSAGVSCGTCQSSPRMAGSLSGAVTFNFLYH